MGSRGPYSTSNYFSSSAAWTSLGIPSVLCWVKPLSIGTYSHVWGMFDDTTTNQYLRIVIDASGYPRVQKRSGTSNFAIHTTPVQVGTWSLLGMTFESGLKEGMKIWHNGVSASYAGVASYPYPVGWNITTVGLRIELGTADQALDALVGPLACWLGSSPLTETEILEAFAGKDLRLIRPADLTNFYSMSGDAGLIDWIGSFDYAEVGEVPLSESTPPVVNQQPCLVDRMQDDRLERITCSWETDPLGRCVCKLPGDVDGTLHRFEASHDDGAVVGSAYDVRLLDDFGADVLIGRGEGLSFNSTESDVITITKTGSPGVHQTVPVMGGHTLVVEAGEPTRGVLELYVLPEITREAGII